MSSQWSENISLKPTHLLWSLIFIKSNGKQREMAPKNKCDEMTWREWVWKGLYRINHLKKDVARAFLLLSSFLQRQNLLLVLSMLLVLVSQKPDQTLQQIYQ
jgi:hypothetical protein